VLNAAVQIGIGITCNAAAPACLGIYNAAQSYAVTGDVGSALKSGAIAAVSALAFQQIGKHFKAEFGIKPGSNLSFGDLELGQQLQWAGSHAVVGGVSSVLSGGKFGHGFISAGFTKMAMGNAGFNLNNRAWPAIAGRTAIAAIVGGTASALTGGKFSNGARTAAMMHLLNGEMRAALRKEVASRAMNEEKSLPELVVDGAISFVSDSWHVTKHAGKFYYYGACSLATGSQSCAANFDILYNDSARIGGAIYEYLHEPNTQAEVNKGLYDLYDISAQNDASQAYLTGRISMTMGVKYYAGGPAASLALFGGMLRASQTYGDNLNVEHLIQNGIGIYGE
ncbi:hypothetical protein, partial [Pseudoalteromonas luteoviolacea]